jgi:ubiquinone/menaquinone biosynthesis C-methylase UbiE/uncharacterized protein YbaR (Trm112 family)
MREQHAQLLACVKCGQSFTIAAVDQVEDDHIVVGRLACYECGEVVPIVGGVPRFVPRENYASGFGLEWTRHARTQYDSYSGIHASEDRFFGQTRWPRRLDGEVILEVGSGSGRFTEQAAQTGATVVSFDYSYAVDANYASNRRFENVLIVQADVYAMPFAAHSFDRVFCFGMLQHTPDPERAFGELPRMPREGGELCADFYKLAFWRTLMQTKYYVRPFTRHMDPDKLYSRVKKWVDFMWPVAGVIRKLPRGYAINWRLLVADYSMLGLKGDMLKEWAYLDTFDMLSPHYDSPQRLGTVKDWAIRAKLDAIDAEYTPHGVVLRARTPVARRATANV